MKLWKKGKEWEMHQLNKLYKDDPFIEFSTDLTDAAHGELQQLMGEKFCELVDNGSKNVPQQVVLNLPKLKKVDSNEPPKLKLPKLKKVDA